MSDNQVAELCALGFIVFCIGLFALIGFVRLIKAKVKK